MCSCLSKSKRYKRMAERKRSIEFELICGRFDPWISVFKVFDSRIFSSAVLHSGISIIFHYSAPSIHNLRQPLVDESCTSNSSCFSELGRNKSKLDYIDIIIRIYNSPFITLSFLAFSVLP